MELRRRVAVHRPGAVVFKQGRYRIAGRFRPAIATEPRLRVRLQLAKCNAHALAVSLTDTLIAANERGERHALGRGKRRVPAGAVLHRRHGVTAGVLRLASRLMADQLLAGDRMLALGKPFELVFTHVAGEPPPLGELAMPDAANHIAFGVIVVAGVLKLLGVIAACLSRA